MRPVRLYSAAEQVAAHLRDEVMRGGLSHRMPGVHQLAAALGVNHKTVAAAIQLLENEQLLVPQGSGRSRRIIVPRGHKPPALRLGILAHDATDRNAGYMIELQHELNEAGHTVFFAPKLLVDLKMNVRRIAAMVDQNPADAWLVIAGSQELLQWFLTRKIAVMAMFGRRRELPVAGVGPDKVPATASATRELIRLGHKRIVYLTRRLRRLPRPGATEQSFLNEMAAHGVPPSPYNLPDWEESVEGFHARLDALVQITPPTALILDEVPLFLAAQQFLAENGIRVPEDVSLICTDTSQDFAWCRRSVAHIRWDSLAVVRRVVRWAANVSRGKEDLRQTLTAAKFVAGGTIGPAKMGGTEDGR
jgi:DNA-binding LacI/PurR family transcriptional regulator